MTRAILSILAFTVFSVSGFAQTATDLNEGSIITHDSSTGASTFSWWGRAGRTYFIQHSDDMIHWNYVPIIESGSDAVIQWGFTSSGNKMFLKLKYTDVPTTDPFTADFDGDGVTNMDELQQGTDPLSADYYVSPAGNDSNPGTYTQPWGTIQHAVDATALGAIAANHAIRITSGTYTGDINFNSFGCTLLGTNVVISGNIIFLGTANTFSFTGTNSISSGSVTINGNSNALSGVGSNIIINGHVTINGANNVVSSITCSPPSPEPADYLNAIGIDGSYNTLKGCTVTNYGASAGNQATAIGMGGSFNSVVSCTVSNLTDIDAFHVFGHDHAIKNCTVIHNQQVHYAPQYPGDQNWNHTDLFQTWGNCEDRQNPGSFLPSYNILWVNCCFLDSTCQMGNLSNDFNSNVYNWTFINCIWTNIGNTLFSGVPNTKYYNCVFYKCAGVPYNAPITFYGGTGYPSYSSSNCEVKNCVFLACGSDLTSATQGGIATVGPTYADVTVDSNYFGSIGYLPKNSDPNSSPFIGTNAVNGGSPSFVDEANYNFHLQSGSVLIGTGANLYSLFLQYGLPMQDADGHALLPVGYLWNIGPYQTVAP